MEKNDDNNKFWTYCGINIPIHIKEVPSIDRVNIRYCDGSQTERFGDYEPFSLEEYQHKYSIARSDGELFWKE